MDSQQHNRLVQIINEKIGNKVCPDCETQSGWLVNPPQEIREYKEGLTLGGALIVPLVSVICNKCSYVKFYSAINLGVVHPRTGKLTLE
jgi:hypothetical protein